jgi:hypothetical protein
MRRRLKSILLLLVSFALTISISPTTYAIPNVVKSSQTVYMNGIQQALDAYNIDGSNYFKLRDIAYVFNNTENQFSISFDAATQTIVATTQRSYEANGSEMIIGDDKSSTAVISNQNLVVDGTTVSFVAYNIGGNNYFKLRDLGDSFGFIVAYNDEAKAVIIKTSDYEGADIKDGTRSNPYSFGDRIEINFVSDSANNFGKLFFTAQDYLSPTEMTSIFNDSYFEHDSTRWFIRANVKLAEYNDDTACDFTTAIESSCVVASNLVSCNYYSWYINPSTYQFFSVYSGGESVCYIPVETNEIAAGETAKYFVISYYTDTNYTRNSVWIEMPQT